MPCIDRNDMIMYRQQKFSVDVSYPRTGPEIDGEIELSVTHNGRQWQSITLSPNEILQVIEALTIHLAYTAKPILRAAEFKSK